MNTNEFERSALDEREWQAQERARIAARTGDGASLAQDPLAARYRRVADALRTPLPDALPADFAARMAQIVQAPAAPVDAPLGEARFESGLMRGLIGVFALAGPVVLSSLTEVEERSLALEVRAFGRPGRRHLLWQTPDSAAQLVARALLLLLLIGLIVGRLSGALPPTP